MNDLKKNDVQKLIETYQELVKEEIIDSYPTVWQLPQVEKNDVEVIPWEVIELIFKRDENEESSFYIEDFLPIMIIEDKLPPERLFEKEWTQPDIFERCAWYVSHHFRPHFNGIFIREECLKMIAEDLYHIDDSVFFRCNSRKSLLPAYLSAMGILFSHELYHFNVDLITTNLECITQELQMYKDYFYNYYTLYLRTSECIEESLANRYTYGRYKSLKVNRETLQKLFALQPPGYSEYYNFKGSNFFLGERKLMQIIIDHGKLSKKTYLYKLPLDQIFKRLGIDKYYKGYHIPIYLVIHRKRRYIRIYGGRMP